MPKNPDENHLNPGQANYERLVSGDRRSASLAEQERRGAASSDSSSIRDREATTGSGAGTWRYTPKPKNSKKPGSRITELIRKRRLLATLGISGGGVVIIIALIIFALIPLKMEMMLKNITRLASAVPQYATEQRVEYLVTRAIAARMLGLANNLSEADTKLVFCKSGAVGCSLFATYSTNYFEKKLGITLDVQESGRVSLGGRASSWNVVTVERGTDGNEIGRITRTIQKNSEMKALIRQEVHSKTKSYQIITRYLARKLLMKKYGVTNFRGPAALEKATNRLAEARSNLQAGIIKNTVAKISPRTALYLTCLQGSLATCEKLRQGIDATKTSGPTATTDDINQAKEPDESLKSSNPDEYARQQAAYERGQLAQQSAEKISTDLAGSSSTVAEDAAKNGISKVITKRILAAAGAGVGIAGILDIIFSAVGSIDNGALDEVSYDITGQTYTGFSSYIKTTNDAMKAGSDSFQSETMGAAMELFDGVESSPLYQAETGLPVVTTAALVGESASAASGVKATCDDGSGKEVATQLAPGELVCPEEKLVRGYTNDLKSNTAWNGIAAVAVGWNATAGVAFDLAGDVVNGMLQFTPGFSQLMAAVGDAAQPALEWIVSLAFPVPKVGYDASASKNYAALSGGIRESQNALMKYGVDEEGNAMGGGGRLLSNDEIVAITSEQDQRDKADYDNQPMIAKLFDTNLAGSFINRMAAYAPISISSLLRLPSTSLANILSGSTASAASTSLALANPFTIPIYGYSANELSADPSEFTEERCKQLADAREASYKKTDGSSVGVYTVSDPCALEKMVVGSVLYDEGVYDDTYSFKRVNNVD